jgi:hypothetical protein
MPTLAGNITPGGHFTWHSFGDNHGGKHVPVPDEFRENARAVARECERVRRVCGNKPLTVTRCFSLPANNKAVGGAPKSQHLLANAADIISPIPTMSVTDLGRLVQMLANEPESRIRFVKVYADGHVHFDCRPGKTVIVEGL